MGQAFTTLDYTAGHKIFRQDGITYRYYTADDGTLHAHAETALATWQKHVLTALGASDAAVDIAVKSSETTADMSQTVGGIREVAHSADHAVNALTMFQFIVQKSAFGATSDNTRVNTEIVGDMVYASWDVDITGEDLAVNGSQSVLKALNTLNHLAMSARSMPGTIGHYMLANMDEDQRIEFQRLVKNLHAS